MRYTRIITLLLAAFLALPASAQEANIQNIEPQVVKRIDDSKGGDRVTSSLGSQLATMDGSARASIRLSPDYKIAPGDTLSVIVTGRVDMGYGSSTSTASKTMTPLSNQVPTTDFGVLPDGMINLPLIGHVKAAGRTVENLRKDVFTSLSAYYKNFTVDIRVSKPGIIKVGISGQVGNPGALSLPATTTVLEALMRAEILPNGSTRRVRLTRGGHTGYIDVYSIVSTGNVEANIPLEAGDQIFVPSIGNWVRVTGEVLRPGRFEMCAINTQKFTVNDLLVLCNGTLPGAEVSRVVIQRAESNGEVKAIHLNIASDAEQIEMQSGDELIVPSASDFQPMIRLVGEFKGEGVYQRAYGTVMSKSGVYKLAKGETVGDVIIRTGGTTPQADLKQARIERRINGSIQTLPIDLDKLITHQDKTVDIALESGDTIIVPALVEKVYVFGQVGRPGGYSYEPDRRLLDYIGQAGGPASRAKGNVMLVRGKAGKSEIIKVSLGKGIRGLEKDNPLIQPGDVIYMPEGVVTDWRDISQLISTVRLLMLF